MSFEGSDDQEVEMVSCNNEINNNNVMQLANSKNNNKAVENIFKQQINDKIKMTTRTMLNQKVVRAMKNVQALYNADANKIFGAGKSRESNGREVEFPNGSS